MKRALAITFIGLGLLGCDQVKRIDEEGSGGPSSAVPGPVQQRLTQSCATSAGCHVTGGSTPDLSAASGGAWVTQSGAGGPFVTFGDVENSYLVQKMLGSSGITGTVMPPPGQPELPPEDLALIVGWVAGVEFPDGETTATTGETMGSDESGEDPSTGGEPGSSESGAEDRVSIIVGLEGDAANGESLFGTNACSAMGCHGEDGLSGSATPSLDMSVPAAMPEDIVETFLDGKGGMPPQSFLEDQQLADLLAYVTETFG